MAEDFEFISVYGQSAENFLTLMIKFEDPFDIEIKKVQSWLGIKLFFAQLLPDPSPKYAKQSGSGACIKENNIIAEGKTFLQAVSGGAFHDPAVFSYNSLKNPISLLRTSLFVSAGSTLPNDISFS